MSRFSALLLICLLTIFTAGPADEQADWKYQFAEARDYQASDWGESTTFKYARWTPGVIHIDNGSSAKIEVWTKGDIDAMELKSGSTSFGFLNDDGLDGDKKAGDDIWTFKGFKREYANLWFPGFNCYGTSVKITRTNGNVEEMPLPSLGMAEKKNYKATKVKKNFYITKYAAFLVDRKGKYLGGKLPLVTLSCGRGNQEAFKTFYTVYPDVFDILAIMPSVAVYHPDDFSENVPYCVPVSNKVKNIGIPIFDNTAEFGSKGKLRAVVYHSFGNPSIFDHEWGHAWGVRIGEAVGFSGFNNKYHGGNNGWHYTSYANLVGQMGSLPQLKLENNGNGTYKVTKIWDEAEDHPYTPLTLYQMGLIPSSQVPPVKILRNKDYPNYDRIPEKEFDTYTIQEIMAANGGERIPKYPNTQKKFRMALIVILDKKPTQAELDYFSSLARHLGTKKKGSHYVTPFYDATGGRAKMVTKLPKLKK